jgi:N-glycosidase YbiA
MSILLEQFRDPQLDISGEVVGFYPREFYCLDNCSAFQVEWRNRLWSTLEHGYHAAKFDHLPDVVEAIHGARSAHEAIRIARSHESEKREDWNLVKLPTMEDLLRHKLTQHPYVLQKLLKTGDMRIVEDSPTDSYWGWGPDRRGKNELGELWMHLREELGAVALGV